MSVSGTEADKVDKRRIVNNKQQANIADRNIKPIQLKRI